MARDYAQRSTNKKKRPPQRHARDRSAMPGWLWMILGLSIGLLVAAVVYVGRPTDAPLPQTATPRPSATPPQKVAATPKLPPKEKPRFSFYELLPSYEVVIPEDSDDTVGGKPGPLVPPGKYVIQVGSFRSAGEAETQKAKLALLGIESRVESVTIDQKDTWYRVRVGPIEDPKQVQATVRQLDANGLDSMLMRVKG